MVDQKTILAVDDEPNNLKLLNQVLKGHYKVIFANDGPSALDAATNHQPDLILLDIMMPNMNGYEVCKRLKGNFATVKIPVIFVTAMNDIEDETLGFDVGAVDYIHKPVSGPTVLRRIHTHLSLIKSDEMRNLVRAAILMLGEAGHLNDGESGFHIWRMAEYAAALARAASWPIDQLEILTLAAPLHDTGNIGIPRTILNAPQKLTEADWAVIKTHPGIGFNILSKSNNPVFSMAAEVALGHHEKWDGTGYPRGIQGKDIPESARIVAIADVFDVLTSKRPYKDAWPVERAFKTIQENSGTHFDPDLVAVFGEISGEILKIKKNWEDI